MKKFFTAVAVLATLTLSTAASAQTVSYYTTGAFSGGMCSGLPGQCIIGNSSISFNGIGSMATPSTTGMGGLSFGELRTQSTTTSPSFDTFTGVLFTLSFFQTAPVSASQVIPGSSISGTLTSNSAGGLFWNPTITNFIAGGFAYTLDAPKGVNGNPDGYRLVSPTSNQGFTSLQGSVAVPEPTSVLLLASGLAGLTAVVRRRRSA